MGKRRLKQMQTHESFVVSWGAIRSRRHLLCLKWRCHRSAAES